MSCSTFRTARPERSLLHAALALTVAAALAGCALPATPDSSITRQRLAPLLPTDVLLLGEQHDAPDHHRIEREAVQALAERNGLAALALEMAEQGRSTVGLARSASEDEVRTALQWPAKEWPWASYGPAVMAAVRADVPVLGANLPSAQLRAAMDRRELDLLLKGPALKAQQQRIRQGHCEMLPENQITPMTRVQIARDLAMAQTVSAAAVPGKTVLLLTGRGHADRSLGVPQHLPPILMVKSVAMQDPAMPAGADSAARFDALWPAQAAPEKDYCAEFKARNPKGVHPAKTDGDRHD
jgi:uncharacterized iron-regulated protein